MLSLLLSSLSQYKRRLLIGLVSLVIIIIFGLREYTSIHNIVFNDDEIVAQTTTIKVVVVHDNQEIFNNDTTSIRTSNNWYDIQYNSGMFHRFKSKEEQRIQNQCRNAAFLYHDTDPCFENENSITTNTSCCFCYDRYPNFILQNNNYDIQYRHHIDKLNILTQQRQSSILYWKRFGIHIPNSIAYNHLEYWFCAIVPPQQRQHEHSTKEQNNYQNIIQINTKWDKYEAIKNQITIITGKFGYENQFHTSVQHLCNQIQDTKLIHHEHIHCYHQLPQFILNDQRFIQHLQYLKDPDDASARGGGYWFHKSVLLQYHMNNMNQNNSRNNLQINNTNSTDADNNKEQYLIWIDNDRFDFVQHSQHFQSLMVIFHERDADFAIEELPMCTEKEWSKEDILQAFNVTENIREQNQVNANAIIIRNNNKMRHFINAWVDCVSDYHMISDDESILPNRYDFIENRHDQSLLGLLVTTFLTNQTMVGPPVRPYHDIGTIHTYHMDDHIVDQVICPFTSFYKSHPLLFPNN